jgi:hypothetical protein
MEKTTKCGKWSTRDFRKARVSLQAECVAKTSPWVGVPSHKEILKEKMI